MDAQLENRNKKKDKLRRNRGFPYKRLALRQEEKLYREDDK